MSIIKISKGLLNGKVYIPASKSVLHRAIIYSAFGNKDIVLKNAYISDDIAVTIEAIKKLGATVNLTESKIIVNGNNFLNLKNDIVIDCKDSASTLRFLIPISLLANKKVSFTGSNRLLERPLKPYFDMFNHKRNKAIIQFNDDLTRKDYFLDGNISSQFITGLLSGLSKTNEKKQIILTSDLESKGYVDITTNLMKDFGIADVKNIRNKYIVDNQNIPTIDSYYIEGDYSQAAFFFVAGAIGSKVKCIGLNRNTVQGDKEILDIIEHVGGIVSYQKNVIEVKKDNLKCIKELDARNIPDLVPILAVLLSLCDGKSKITNIKRLRIKESDRLHAITTELNKLGAEIEEFDDYMVINGVKEFTGGNVDSWKDHRIAMALAIAATRANGDVYIDNCEAVEKSYPDFWKIYNSLKSEESYEHMGK